MFKVIALGLAFGAGFQAYRNLPPDGPVTVNGALVVLILGTVAAYLAGRSRRPTSNVAVAVASAEATAVASNQVNVAVVVPGHGAGSGSGGVLIPSTAAPWLGDQRLALDESVPEGADLRDLGLEYDSEQDYAE